MKAFISNKTDWDNEVIDVTLVLEENDIQTVCHIKGFDDVDWKDAVAFAEKLSTVLNIQYLGDMTDT